MNIKLFNNPQPVWLVRVFLQNGQVYYQTRNSSAPWQAMSNEPAKLVDVVVAFSDVIFALDVQSYIWMFDRGKGWIKDVDAKNVATIASDEWGLWCVNEDGQCWLKESPHPGTQWRKIDENIPAQAGDFAAQIWEYVVKPGDWLWKIVRNEYGTATNHAVTAALVAQVESLNPNIAQWDNLQVGTKLKMPPKAPTPIQPTDCPTIEYEVVVSVAPSVKVGDTFVLRSSSSCFAGLAQTRLYIEYRLASIIPELDVTDPLPAVEVLPDSTGSSLGSAEFVLRALRPGIVRLYTEVYGDAFFYGIGCVPSTTFKLVRSEPLSVSIEP